MSIGNEEMKISGNQEFLVQLNPQNPQNPQSSIHSVPQCVMQHLVGYLLLTMIVFENADIGSPFP